MSEIFFVLLLITLTTNTSYNDDIVTKFSILFLLILNSVNFNDIIINAERDRLIQLVTLQTLVFKLQTIKHCVKCCFNMDCGYFHHLLL